MRFAKGIWGSLIKKVPEKLNRIIDDSGTSPRIVEPVVLAEIVQCFERVGLVDVPDRPTGSETAFLIDELERRNYSGYEIASSIPISLPASCWSCQLAYGMGMLPESRDPVQLVKHSVGHFGGVWKGTAGFVLGCSFKDPDGKKWRVCTDCSFRVSEKLPSGSGKKLQKHIETGDCDAQIWPAIQHFYKKSVYRSPIPQQMQGNGASPPNIIDPGKTVSYS